jgi:hypothetical protein
MEKLERVRMDVFLSIPGAVKGIQMRLQTVFQRLVQI